MTGWQSIEHSPMPTAEVAEAGHLVRYVNDAFCRMVGRARDELVGRPFVEIVRKGDECLALLDRVFHTGEVESHTEVVHPEPNPFYWSYVMWPVRMGGQSPTGVIFQVTETAPFHRRAVEMNESMLLAALRQHEITEEREREKSAQLQAEIIERKQAELAARESEERFRILVEQVKDYAIFSTDTAGRATSWNEGVQRVLDFEEREFIGLDILPVIFTPEDFAAGVPQQELRTAAEHGSASDDRWMRRKDGTRFFATGITTGLRNPAGEHIGFTVVMRDSTQSKRAEDNLAFLAELGVAFAPLASAEEILQVAGERICRHFGLSRVNFSAINATGDEATVFYGRRDPGLKDDVRAHRLTEYFTDALLSELKAGVTIGINDVRTDPRTAPHASNYAQWRVGSLALVPYVRNRQWKFLFAAHKSAPHVWAADELALLRELSTRVYVRFERARAEQSLREAAERFRFMAESMPQKIFTAKPNGDVDYYNPQWFEFSGLTFEQMRDWGWTQFVHPDDLEETILRWRDAVKSGEPFQFAHRFRRHDGVYRWHLSRARPMRDGEGKITTWIGSNTEIEDQKRAEEKLEKTVAERTAKLRETVQDLEAFSYSIAHDMRAPLRAMQGFSTMLQHEYGEQIKGAGKEYLHRIAASASRLDRLIQDVLDYSKIVRADLSIEPMDAERFIHEILQSYPNLHPTRAQIRVQGPIPKVMANEAALTQVVSNLLGNAVKFVQPKVKPRVRIWAESRPLDMIRIWFEDNGIGIPKEVQERMFIMFQRLNPPGQYEGTGIGLAIVRKAVERMGGKVGVESEPGEGSRFWIELKGVK